MDFVCKRCGYAVHLWAYGWKHSVGPGGKSCGKHPLVVSRESFDKEMAALASGIAAAIKRNTDGHQG